MIKLPFSLPDFKPGWVWLAGAGPGDPGLLTLHALHGLQQADIIIYDALVDKDILSLAQPGVQLEYAGKRGGRPSPRQPDISYRLVQAAQQGSRVLRLKGGDPFVFGRGGEEALALVAARIPFRIIPGITAGIGGLAYAGIPVTYRSTNHVVSFVTGHNMHGLVPDEIDWTALAHSSPVLVMYMALKHLPVIVERLRDAGRVDDEPVAIITNATRLDQHVLETNLRDCVAMSQTHNLRPPAILVLGPVVKFRGALDWLGSGLTEREQGLKQLDLDSVDPTLYHDKAAG